jgi:DNA repair exonuclease SbcCD nuclease subunit
MIKFIHAADIHLDSPLHRLEAYEGAPVADIRQASRRAFENLIDLALDEAVHFVLISGDLFDGDWKDYHTGLYFVRQMHRLKTAGIAVYIVSGNHDAAGQMTRRLPYPDNVHLFDHRRPQTRRIEDLKVALHGQSFARPAVLDNLARSYPEPLPGYVNIGLLHTSLNGREGHASYAPCTLEDLHNRGYDYWALGHVHQFEIVSPDPPVVFPGCIQGRHIRETGIKGGILVTLSEDAPPGIIHHACDVIRWTRLEIALPTDATPQAALAHCVTALETEVRRHDPLPLIVRVTFSGATAAHAAMAGDLIHWNEAVRSAAMAEFGEQVWIEKVRVATRPPAQNGKPSINPGPLQEMEQVVAEILSDDDLLATLGDALARLFQKLPAEYRQSSEAFAPKDPVRMRHTVEEAHALLKRGLLKEAHRQ